MSRYEELWKLAWTLLLILLLLIAIFATASSSHLVVYDSKSADLGAIALGSATIVLTGVTVIVGVGALWGYREIRDVLIRAAIAHTEQVATKIAAETAERLVPRLIEARFGSEESGDGETSDLGAAFPRGSDTK